LRPMREQTVGLVDPIFVDVRDGDNGVQVLRGRPEVIKVGPEPQGDRVAQ